jgi:CBS domain-containing protein
VKVRDVMMTTRLATVRPGDDLALAAQIMSWSNGRHLPVVEGDETVGVISERDILTHRRPGSTGASDIAVREVMRHPAVTIDADAPLVAAISLMFGRKLGCLPVLEEGTLVGILTTTDLLRHELDTAFQGPAGKLSGAVRMFMKPVPAVVTPANELFDAAALMGARGIWHLPVVDDAKRVVGVLSDRDVRTALGDPRRFLTDPGARERFRQTSIADVMSKPASTVHADAPITTAIDQLLHDRVGALPVVDDQGRILGILSYLDFIQMMRDRL